MITRIYRLPLGLSVILLLTGCWDKIEIEDRGFIVATAIDQAPERKLKVTYQMVVPKAMQNKSSEGGPEEPFFNLSAVANTLFLATRDMSNTSSRPPYLEHNRVILLSEKLSREGDIGNVLDLLVRDSETRRAAKVMVTKGEAAQILSIRPRLESLPAQYIDSTAENPRKTGSITPPTNIGDVHRFLLRKASFAMPVIAGFPDDHKIMLSGAAVFHGKDNRLRGFLNAEETTSRNLITGSIKSTAIETKLEDDYIVYEVKKLKRRIRANTASPRHPVFDIDIETQGNLGESHLELSVLDHSLIQKSEQAFERKIVQMTEEVIRKLQSEYKSDILGLGEFLDKNHHRIWEQIEPDWEDGEQLFSNCEVRVHVRVEAAFVGSILKTE
ncbi:Ger(x)C family spore germination protein [Gorillibacterium timonense]|uniref:Ger(x)C family spore germination protein n=1 Tax=Gorillibacterium timonense TaxID=1689269 RepID=UPI00071D2102|nr:Ger(x)C family spore germination protein [Gorillibacterium timonense]